VPFTNDPSGARGAGRTLIGNRFVENLPLNVRSFSSLIDLTPGVVLIPTNFNEQGQLSVNGQRPDANYFMVDGVSANLGAAGNGDLLGLSGAGQLPATNTFGGTSNLVSLVALEEFRIQTSTFVPEYGRTPGAQISVVTKSGTNTFHGTAFKYFRNDKLDANDWFANANGRARPEAAERFRRRSGRPDRQKQAVLLRLLRGVAEVFSVEEACFRLTSRSRYDALPPDSIEEEERIESGLEKSRGRISGPRGAATRLGIPRTTLEAKIKRLTTNKYKYQPVSQA
jgi:hypothetical protein